MSFQNGVGLLNLGYLIRNMRFVKNVGKIGWKHLIIWWCIYLEKWRKWKRDRPYFFGAKENCNSCQVYCYCCSCYFWYNEQYYEWRHVLQSWIWNSSPLLLLLFELLIWFCYIWSTLILTCFRLNEKSKVLLTLFTT